MNPTHICNTAACQIMSFHLIISPNEAFWQEQFTFLDGCVFRKNKLSLSWNGLYILAISRQEEINEEILDSKRKVVKKEKEVWLWGRKTKLLQTMRCCLGLTPLWLDTLLFQGNRPHYFSQTAVKSCELGYKWLCIKEVFQGVHRIMGYEKGRLFGRGGHAYLGTFMLLVEIQNIVFVIFRL